jgi:hypothetical protein
MVYVRARHCLSQIGQATKWIRYFIEQMVEKSIPSLMRTPLKRNAELEREINERLNDWENPENIDEIRKTCVNSAGWAKC